MFEVRYGAEVWGRYVANQSCISLPLHLPETPAFGRETFQHMIKTVIKNYVYDDLCMPIMSSVSEVG